MIRLALTLLVALVVSGCAAPPLTDYVVDPLRVAPPSSPNWALAAPREAGMEALQTRETPIYATGPDELIAHLDAVAVTDVQVERVVLPGGDALQRAYVQRSDLFGFPDVISVRAIDLGVGDAGQRASLAIFSRSVYGYSDLGVNAERIDRWLERLDARVDQAR